MEDENQQKGDSKMLKTSERQGSFYDTEYIYEGLIPSDSFYRKFREEVWPLIKDGDFEKRVPDTRSNPN